MVRKKRNIFCTKMAKRNGSKYVETPLTDLREDENLSTDIEISTSGWQTDVTHNVFEFETNEFKCKTFRKNSLKMIFYYIVGVSTGFLGFLVAYWCPVHRVLLTHDSCRPEDANAVVIEESDGTRLYIPMKTLRSTSKESGQDMLCSTVQDSCDKELIYFVYRFLKYFWNEQKQQFIELVGYPDIVAVKNDVTTLAGISDHEREMKLQKYGKNFIDVPVRSFIRVFAELALDPFYIFQLFSCTLWILQDYLSLSVFVLVVSFFGLVFSTYSTRKQLKKIKGMVSQNRPVQLIPYRDNHRDFLTNERQINSENLVPGDIIIVCDKYHMLCDAILLSGHCVVDESLITGESVPVQKGNLNDGDLTATDFRKPENLWNDPCLRRHILFNGTNVVKTIPEEADNKVYAMVISTGFYTLKGRLLRSIILTSPLTFKFFRDSMKFLLVVGCLAACGFFYSVYILHQQGTSIKTIFFKGLDIFTIAIPPVLPIALSTGILLAARKLKLNSIYCTDLPTINSCGKIKLVCMDKTGTLTCNSLSVHLVLSCSDGTFNTPSHLAEDITDKNVTKALASCHSLTLVDQQVVGDPLEIEILKFSGWQLCPSVDLQRQSKNFLIRPLARVTQRQNSVTVWKLFDFDPNIKRMSILATEDEQNTVVVYSKGSPEAIASLCIPSTLPENFDEFLEMFTSLGYRVLAYAWKLYGKLDHSFEKEIQNISRDFTESQLTFCGFVVFENSLKPATKAVINELHSASIKTVMVTGDHLNTAVSVGFKSVILSSSSVVAEVSQDAVNCLLIKPMKNIQYNNNMPLQPSLPVYLSDLETEYIATSSNQEKMPFFGKEEQFVMTGDTAEKLKKEYPDLYEGILVKSKIFARTSPDQKACLVKDLMSLGYTVCMCGDGANDCGALKVANAGISLTESEASIAAPFTSMIQDITCIPILIREGRAALVTSFCCFKFIILYSLIQFITVLILYSVGSNLSDYQFLFIDFMGIGLAAVIAEARSFPSLAIQRPLGRLFHPVVIFSVFIQVFVQLSFQLVVFFYVRQMRWYQPPNKYDSEFYELSVKCLENTSVFAISSFQYLIVAMAFSDGPPFRQSSLLNVRFVFFVTAFSSFVLFLVVYPQRHLQDLLLLVRIQDHSFTGSLVGIALGNAAISCLLEKYILPSKRMKCFLNRMRGKSAPRNLYKRTT